MKNVSYRVALGGIVSALCLLSMLLAGIIPAAALVMPMIAGVLLTIISIEVSSQWAFLTYASVGILSMFITFDKEAALIFIMLFGHYPILRMHLQKIRSRIIRIALKFIIFNISIITFFCLTVYLLGLQQTLDEMDKLGRYGKQVMLCSVNVVFMLYDINPDACYIIYIKRIKPKFNKY